MVSPQSYPTPLPGGRRPKWKAPPDVQQERAEGGGRTMKQRKSGALSRRTFAQGLAGGGLAWAAGQQLAAAASRPRITPAVPASASGDWPTYRHDPGLTALS